MSVSSTQSRNLHFGNDSASEYSFSFPIVNRYDLLITVKNTSEQEVTLSIDQDYTVEGVGDEEGGSITLVNGSQAWLNADGTLKNDYAIAIRQNIEPTQPADFRNQGEFFPETHEDAFDRAALVAQGIQGQVYRSLKYPETEDMDFGDEVLPTAAQRANKFLAFDADGLPMASAGGISSELPVSSYMETVLDDTTAADARTTLDAVGLTGNENIEGVKNFVGQLKGVGTTTNDAAATGYIGEYVSATAGSFTGANGVWGNMTSISLTAGDWDVSGMGFYSSGADVKSVSLGISTTTGNSTTGLTYGDNRAEAPGPTAANNDHSLSIPSYRMSLSATTTVYLKYQTTFTTTSPNMLGRISARRVR